MMPPRKYPLTIIITLKLYHLTICLSIFINHFKSKSILFSDKILLSMHVSVIFKKGHMPPRGRIIRKYMKKEKIYSTFSHIPTIESENIILRKLLVSDADDFFDYAHDRTLTEYLTWSPHPDKEYTVRYLQYVTSRYRTGDFYDWAIVDKKSGKMIGTCGFTRFDFINNAAEIGYVVNPSFRGRGIASEALGRVIKFGFEELPLNRLECRYIDGNTASRRVMEKNHMTFEGIKREGILVKGLYRDVGTCSLLKSEYRKYCLATDEGPVGEA